MTTKFASAALATLALGTVAACGGSGSGGSTGSGAGAGTTSASAGGSSGGGSGAVQHPTSLKGEVGEDDAFAISLTDENDKPITNLAAGTYKLKVEDYSTIHDFHLTGPGVNVATPIGSKVEKTFTVTFKPGQYHFQCDPHASQMMGDFTVS